MRKQMIVAAVLTALVCAPVMAATAQQNRMKECNAQAAGKSGDERKAFMSGCLKGENSGLSEKQLSPQQQRMRDCNEQAKGKKGDERKKLMSSCLKAPGEGSKTPEKK